MKYSFVIPVYNRPDEIRELLQSLKLQKHKDFEAIVVEDGSSVTCENVCDEFRNQLDIKYFFKPNSGPGPTRNYGAERASGEYLLILDSDVMLPAGYLNAVEDELLRIPADAFGGPDRTHSSFSAKQKAISYSMTSFFTTGGIRGGRKKLDKFYPRSFNMGIRKDVYRHLGGFSKMRFGEDVDFSIRIYKEGYRCRLFPDAWVWHKRRTDFRKFWRQVFNSGIARINLYKKYPESLKFVHLLPAAFTIGCVLLILCALIFHAWLWLLPIIVYILLILADSTIKNKSLRIGFLSILATFIQLFGYGFGFIKAFWKRVIRHSDEFSAYNNNFYK